MTMIEFVFANLKFDGSEPSYEDIHRFVGDFSILINGILLYSEYNFCLLEFAAYLNYWKNNHINNRDFQYESIESDLEKLVWFEHKGDALYLINTVYEKKNELQELVPIESIHMAIDKYIQTLHLSLVEKFGMNLNLDPKNLPKWVKLRD